MVHIYDNGNAYEVEFIINDSSIVERDLVIKLKKSSKRHTNQQPIYSGNNKITTLMSETHEIGKRKADFFKRFGFDIKILILSEIHLFNIPLIEILNKQKTLNSELNMN